MNERISNPSAKATQEFLSEAQDITEHLGQSLMDIDEALKKGEPDPELINDIFRGMHTLKSLCGMFEVRSLASLAHVEESLLEEVRLGRVSLNAYVLDILFESLELITGTLTTISLSGNPRATDESIEVDSIIAKIDRIIKGEPAADSVAPKAPFEKPSVASFDPDVLEVLTEYEEHRLTTNLNRGHPFVRVICQFDLETIDVDLDVTKNKLKPTGEIITYLPSSDEVDSDKLGIDIILAVHEPLASLETITEGMEAKFVLIAPGRDESVPVSEEEAEPEKDPAAKQSGRETLPPPPTTFSQAPLRVRTDEERGISLRSVSQTVRVDIQKLDKLMNVVGELAIVRNAIGRISGEMRETVGRSDLAIEIHRINRGFDRRLVELQEGILEVRMVPLSQVFDRLARVVRKISRGLGKEIHLVVSGAETEVDKLIIEELSDPLMHIVRNAIDHGVEETTERRAAGKPEFGTVALTAYQKGNHVVIEIEDDGAGIDTDRIVEIASERDLIDDEMLGALAPEEIVNLIFLPGFSTSSQTTELSGRGVGMDVVKTNISAMGGLVEVQSESGIGTKFSITLPVTLAIIPTLLVESSEHTYAVPLNTVSEAVFVSRADIKTVLGTQTITLRGESLALCQLTELFGSPRAESASKDVCVVVASLGQRRIGLEVETLIGQQEVVIKPLGASLDDARFFVGATDMGDEKLALVLDTGAIIEEFFSRDTAELQGKVQQG